jgi:hypothetical protein
MVKIKMSNKKWYNAKNAMMITFMILMTMIGFACAVFSILDSSSILNINYLLCINNPEPMMAAEA